MPIEAQFFSSAPKLDILNKSSSQGGEGSSEFLLGVWPLNAVNAQKDTIIDSGTNIDADIALTGIEPPFNFDALDINIPVRRAVDVIWGNVWRHLEKPKIKRDWLVWSKACFNRCPPHGDRNSFELAFVKR